VIETAARSAQFLLAVGIAYVVALWFALVAWTFRDIEARSRSVFTQVFSTLLVVLFFVPGLLLYLILRPKETLDQAFQRALEEEYLLQDLDELPLCPGCQRSVDPEFVLCPNCQTSLRGACTSCSRLIDLRWTVCPYCAVAVDAEARKAGLNRPGGIEAVQLLDENRADRRQRAVAAAAQRVGIPPEDLDAFTDAISTPVNHAAVSAGNSFTRRVSSVAGAARPRSATRGRIDQNHGGSGEPSQETDEEVLFAGKKPDSSSRDGGFWADPLLGPDRPRDSS